MTPDWWILPELLVVMLLRDIDGDINYHTHVFILMAMTLAVYNVIRDNIDHDISDEINDNDIDGIMIILTNIKDRTVSNKH